MPQGLFQLRDFLLLLLRAFPGKQERFQDGLVTALQQAVDGIGAVVNMQKTLTPTQPGMGQGHYRVQGRKGFLCRQIRGKQ